MELSLLKERMEGLEPIGPFLAFSCQDREIANVYVSKIAELYGLETRAADSVSDALSAMSEVGLADFGARLFVVRDDASFMSNEKAWPSVGGLDGEDVLVLVFQSQSAKPSFVKAMGDSVVEFRRMSHKVMCEQILKPLFGDGISDGRVDALASLCEDDYGTCSSEADKVLRLSAVSGRGLDWSFDYLKSTGQLGIGRMNDRYHFANSFVMGSRDTFDACYGVDPLELISLLYAQCRSMYMALCNADSPNPCKATGMSYAQFKAYRYKSHSIRTGDLIRVMRVLQSAEQGIKTGSMPKELSMKYVMAKAFGYALR